MEIKIVMTSHRVEFIPMLRDEALNSEIIILEEPPNQNLFDFFEGKMSVEDYVRGVDTSFPLYTYFLSDLLKNLHSMGKEIHQIEPYLEIIQKLQKSIEDGSFEDLIKNPEIERVRLVEKRAFGAFIDYQEAFLSGDFERLIESTIEFSKADAERFRVRDCMRAKEVTRFIEHCRYHKHHEQELRILIEAGSIHSRLYPALKKVFKSDYIEVINLKEIVARNVGLEMLDNPGNQLTEVFLMGKEFDKKDLKLLAARSLVYISKITPEEMLPDDENEYPHLLEEINTIKEVMKMNYEECKQEFTRIWKRKLRK